VDSPDPLGNFFARARSMIAVQTPQAAGFKLLFEVLQQLVDRRAGILNFLRTFPAGLHLIL
jgi:hypothetical protein